MNVVWGPCAAPCLLLSWWITLAAGTCPMTASDSHPGGTICQRLWWCVSGKSLALDRAVVSLSLSLSPAQMLWSPRAVCSRLWQCQLSCLFWGCLHCWNKRFFHSIPCKDVHLFRAKSYFLKFFEWWIHCFGCITPLLPSILPSILPPFFSSSFPSLPPF